MMIVLRYKNIPGKTVTITDRLDVTLDDIEWLVKNPNVDSLKYYSSKDECKSNQNLLYWGDVLDHNNTNIKNNYGKRSAIILDYDGDIEIDDFIIKFNGKFKFYLYTSISHNSDVHKFRVIIPTLEPFTMTRYHKIVFQRCFPNTDRSTFDNRGFYEPVKINSYYGYYISEGPVFDLDKKLGRSIEREEQYHIDELRRDAQRRADLRRERELMGIPDASIEYRKQCYIDKCIDPDLRAVNWGRDGAGRYHVLGKIMYKMGNADFDGEMFDNDEIYDIIMPYLYEQKHKNNLLRYLDNR